MQSKSLKKRIIIVTVLIIAAIIGIICSFTILFKKPKADNSTTNNSKPYEAIERDTKITVDSSGTLQITRNRVEDTNELEDDSWTVLIYMVGTDEDDRGADSSDLDSIKNCNINGNNIDKYNIVLQAGGNQGWYNNYGFLGQNKITRNVLTKDHKWETVDNLGKGNMGDAKTFSDFLEWGLTTYPAEHTMLIMYDHGGAGTGGVCYDPYSDDDCITIDELEYCMAKNKKNMKDRLDLVYIAACSAGSLEYSNAVAPYADYLVASADYHYALGFALDKPINKIIDQPDIETKELAKLCVSSNADKIKSYGLSVSQLANGAYDLGKLDAVLIEMNGVLKQLYDYASKDVKSARKIHKLFTRNTYSYRSGKQYDANSLLGSASDIGIDITKARSAIKEYVTWYVKGNALSKQSYIISLMYIDGNKAFGKGALNITRNVTFSPYMMNLIELNSHMLVNRTLDKFVKYDWAKSEFFFEDTFDFLNYKNYVYGSDKATDKVIEDQLRSNPDYVAAGFIDNWMDNKANKSIDERILNENLEIVYEEDKTTTQLPKDMDDIEDVYNTVYAKINDTEVSLGENLDATYDKETGMVQTNFKGQWFMLGDGQLLTVYLESKGEDDYGEYTLYSSPVYMDEKEATLYIYVSKDNVMINGIAYSTDDEGGAVFLDVNTETTFTPIYDVWNEEEKTYDTEYGEEYKIKGKNDVLYTQLPDGEYSYSIILDNALGTKTFTKPRTFQMQDGKITYK